MELRAREQIHEAKNDDVAATLQFPSFSNLQAMHSGLGGQND